MRSYSEDFVVYDRYSNMPRPRLKGARHRWYLAPAFPIHAGKDQTAWWIYNDLKWRGFPPLMVYNALLRCIDEGDKDCVRELMLEYGITEYKYLRALAYFFGGTEAEERVADLLGGKNNGKKWRWWRRLLPISEIRNRFAFLRKEGVHFEDALLLLAREYRVSKSTIYRIIRGESNGR